MRALYLTALIVLAACRGAEAPAPLRAADVLENDGVTGFDRALEPREFRFPTDHGAHPAFRTEWWYLTGHLASVEREFGYQLTFFRLGLTPGAEPQGQGWRAGHLYLAHFALADLSGQTFHAAERFSRGAEGLAGAATDRFRVGVEDWTMALDSGVLRARANDRGHALELVLSPAGPPVLNGDGGLSRKSAPAGNASYYYSMPRWTATGTVRLPEAEFRVTGDGWLDREWSSGALAADQSGWDWFALTFDDRSALMLYRLRDQAGDTHPFSGGTFIAPDGTVRVLAAADAEYRPRRHWRSPATGARYPVAWRISLPALELTLEVEPLLDDQELDLSFRYWEGAVTVAGARGGRPLSGRGYLELTGYGGG